MKKMKFLLYASFLFFIISCTKTIGVDDPQLEVATDDLNIRAGSRVTFKIGTKNTPDILFFFSGEPNKEYAYSYGAGAGRFLVNRSGYDFSFQSRFDYNSPPTDSANKYGLQKNQLTVLASTDFNGILDQQSVAKANWTNITDKFTLPAAQHASSFTNSGVNTLQDVIANGKPLYIAFKLITEKQRLKGYSQFWNVQNFLIKAKDSVAGSLPNLYNMGKMEFNFVDITEPVRSSILSRTATVIRMGGPKPYIGTTPQEDSLIAAHNLVVDPDYSEAWAISARINVDTVFLGYDMPTATVAGYTDVKFKDEYTYVYTKPGIYKAVFVAENRSKDQTKTLIKEFTISVSP